MPVFPLRPAVARTLLLAAALGCGGSDPTGTAPNVVARVEASLSSASLLVGGTQPLSATPRDAAGNVLGTVSVAWRSAAPTVATVSAAGLVTGVAPGSAAIVAAAGGREDTVAVTVRAGGTIAAAGGSVSAEGVTLTFPAGALPAATAITVEPATNVGESDNLVGGSAYEFGPDGTQFAQPVTLELPFDVAALPEGADVASLRVAKRTDSGWSIITEGAALDAANGRVRASIRSFSSYGVVSDPCVVRQLGPTGIRGRIVEDDCLYPVAGRRSDYYGFTPPVGEVVVLAPTGALVGLIGLKEATTDPEAGTVWGSRAIGDTLRLIANGDPLQLFVSGQDSTRYGSYHVVRSTETAAYRCGRRYYLTPGASVAQTLVPQSSCRTTIQFSPFPEVIGQPIDVQYWYAKLTAGRTHTITLDGLTESWQPGLTLFRDGQVAAQSVGSAAGTRRVLTITPETDGYYAIEISSGPPPQGSTTLPSGSYTLSTSR